MTLLSMSSPGLVDRVPSGTQEAMDLIHFFVQRLCLTRVYQVTFHMIEWFKTRSHSRFIHSHYRCRPGYTTKYC